MISSERNLGISLLEADPKLLSNAVLRNLRGKPSSLLGKGASASRLIGQKTKDALAIIESILSEEEAPDAESLDGQGIASLPYLIIPWQRFQYQEANSSIARKVEARLIKLDSLPDRLHLDATNVGAFVSALTCQCIPCEKDVKVNVHWLENYMNPYAFYNLFDSAQASGLVLDSSTLSSLPLDNAIRMPIWIPPLLTDNERLRYLASTLTSLPFFHDDAHCMDIVSDPTESAHDAGDFMAQIEEDARMEMWTDVINLAQWAYGVSVSCNLCSGKISGRA